VGLLDRLRRRAPHDEHAIRDLLEAKGATGAEAQELVEVLGRRLSPDDMHVWLTDPERSHPVPDPDAAKQFEAAGLIGAPLSWTPINAISAGKAQLVIDEARRYVDQTA
jgi:hypothetical protein